MQQETGFKPGRFEVIVDLPGRDPRQLSARLDLYDQNLIDDHVQPLLTQRLTLVHDPYAHLARDTMPASAELPFEAHDVDVLDESKSEGVINRVERSDYGLRELFFDEWSWHGFRIGRRPPRPPSSKCAHHRSPSPSPLPLHPSHRRIR